MKILREFFDYIKTERRQEKEMKRLLSERLDYELLRKLLNELPFNPGVKLRITLKTGEVIEFIQDKIEKPEDPFLGFDGEKWEIK